MAEEGPIIEPVHGGKPRRSALFYTQKIRTNFYQSVGMQKID